MTTANESHDPHPIDLHARRLHDAALAQVSPDTLARLRRARHAASTAEPRRRSLLAPWLAGGAVAATLALALVLRPGAPVSPSPVTPVTLADTATIASDLAAVGPDPAETLQDDPGFYVWLGSLDTHAIAME